MTRDRLIFEATPALLAPRIRDALAATPPPGGLDPTVGTIIPTGRDTGARTPLVVITQDGPGSIRTRIHHAAPIRVLAWAPTEDATDDLIQHVHAITTALHDDSIAAVTPLTAPWVDTDPDSGRPMGAFTVTVHQIATTLTSH